MRKVADWPDRQDCRHPSHSPPGMIVLEPGIYEHECPACHQKQVVNVPPKPRL